MTLRFSDWQSESGLDSIRNSCDVFKLTCLWKFEARGYRIFSYRKNLLLELLPQTPKSPQMILYHPPAQRTFATCPHQGQIDCYRMFFLQEVTEKENATLYHYFPHNQHLFQLPDCASQQVALSASFEILSCIISKPSREYAQLFPRCATQCISDSTSRSPCAPAPSLVTPAPRPLSPPMDIPWV